jgi:Mrp family chromosome partitioning ATPase
VTGVDIGAVAAGLVGFRAHEHVFARFQQKASGMSTAPLAVSTVEQIAQKLKQAVETGRRIGVAGTMRNVGTTFAAMSLARTLAADAKVVLVDLAFGAPNLSIISTEPEVPGIAELVCGTASFGDIITCDRYSPVHVVATGNVGSDAPEIAASPILATAIEALMHSYDYVVIAIGSAADVAVEQFVPFTTRAGVGYRRDPGNPATRAARERLLQVGFAEVMLMACVPKVAAA